MTLEDSQEPRAIASQRTFATPVALWMWPFAVGIGGYLFVAFYGSGLLSDADTFTHIAFGRWIIEHRAIPFHDPFSYTFQGKLWVPAEWLSEVIFASIYRHFGWGGICAITALAIGAALTLLTRRLMDWLEPPRPAIAAGIALLLSTNHILARSHVLAMPFMVVWISGLVSAREAKCSPSLALLPIMTLWANLHGSFVIGLVFCVLLGLEAVFAAEGWSRWEVTRQWGIFTICAVACALLSPNGFTGLLFPVHVLQMPKMLAGVAEWQSPNFHQFQFLELWICLVILCGFSFGIRLPVMRILMVLLLLHEALFSVRNTELVGFIVPLLVAGPLAMQLPASAATVQRPLRISTAHAAFVSLCHGAVPLLIAAFLFFPTAALLNERGIRPSQIMAPESALEAARAAGLTGPVWNAYNFGGYLIFEGLPVFIDGRAEPYTDEFLGDAFAAEAGRGEQLTKLLDRYGIEWTLLRPNGAAVGLLDHLPNWKRVYGDEYAVVHRRVM